MQASAVLSCESANETTAHLDSIHTICILSIVLKRGCKIKVEVRLAGHATAPGSPRRSRSIDNRGFQ